MGMKSYRCVLASVGIVSLLLIAVRKKWPDVVDHFTIVDTSNPDVQAEEQEFGNGPLAFIRRSGQVKTLLGINLENMTSQEMLMTIHSYPDNIDTICERKIRLGKIGDGGWEICDDPDVRPRAPCIIYDYGIHYDFLFDDNAAKLYGCHIYSFDPDMHKMDDQVNRSELIKFYKVGLSGKSQVVPKKNWKLYTHSDLRKMLGHQNQTIDVIKMDIEWSEWDAIPEMVASGQFNGVRQFLVEYHVVSSGRKYLLPRLKAMQELEKAGFKRFYVHKNPECGITIHGFPTKRTQCYEVHYVRR